MQQQHRFTQRNGWLGVAVFMSCLLAVVLARPAYATDFRGGDTIVIGDNEVIDDDLFIAGQTVVINGVVKGDVFATGAAITVNGTVEGSLFMSARTLAINGQVNGSTYAGGYSLTLGEAAVIAHNLSFGGYSLEAMAGSTIGRSLYGGGYQLLLNGQIARDANIAAAALVVTGGIGGDLRGSVSGSTDSTMPTFMPTFEGAVDTVEPGLRVSPNAQIDGAMAIETVAAEAAVAPPFFSLENANFRWAIGEFLALLIVGLLLFYLRPTLIRRTNAILQERPLPSLGVGLLSVVIVMIGTPIVIGLIVLLVIFGGGLTLGQLVGEIVSLGLSTLFFALTIFLFVAGMVTKIIVAYMGGNWLLRRVGSANTSTGMELIAFVLGLLIYIVLRSIPFGVGALIGLLVTLLGLGALYFALRATRQTALMAAPSAPLVETDSPA